MKIIYSPVKRTTSLDYEAILPLATVKKHLRMDHDDDDDVIEIYRDAAIDVAQHETGLMLGEDTYKFYMSDVPCNGQSFNIPVYPVATVESIKIHDGTTWQTLSASNYDADVNAEPCKVLMIDNDIDVNDEKSLPVEVTVTGGYSNATMPKAMTNAILLLIGHLYENRQDVVSGTVVTVVPKSSQYLFNTLRIIY